jgi:hypothetical protein
MYGNKESCPRCGQWAELPEGTFNVTAGTIEVLTASDLTRERLARLAQIVDAARAGDISEEEATQAVIKEAPALAGLFNALGPRMGRALIVLLFAVIQILASQAVSELRDDSPSRADLEKAIARAVDECRQQAP